MFLAVFPASSNGLAELPQDLAFSPHLVSRPRREGDAWDALISLNRRSPC